ncbi:MAG: dipeptide epimerase [Armatimonadetes bacterium]|nr:dipeptide epimerase [Armatimonadota bacterium]MDW8120857.1 dipeptide epimerase [Armatimonadota bacterium]
MSESRIADLVWEPLRIPLHTPFAISQETTEWTDNWFVRLIVTDGWEGWGEAAPSRALMNETADSVKEALEKVAPLLIGQPVSWSLLHGQVGEVLTHHRAARGALEMALLDAIGKKQGRPLWLFFGGATDQLETDVTIPILPKDQVEELTKRFVSMGFRRFKIKLSGEWEEDLERIVTVHRLTGRSWLQLDANQAYQPNDALVLLARLGEKGITPVLFEQPVERADLKGLAWLTQRSVVPIIADESVTSEEDAVRLIAQKAAHGINIKVMKTGFSESLRIIQRAKEAGLLLMIGAMVETELGLTAAAQLAAGVGGFAFYDLDTHLFLEKSFFEPGFVASGPVFRMTNRPGWGVLRKGGSLTAP